MLSLHSFYTLLLFNFVLIEIFTKAMVSSVVFVKQQQNASALPHHTLKLHSSDDGQKCLLIEEWLREIEGDKDRSRERWSRQSCPACVLDGTGLCSNWTRAFCIMAESPDTESCSHNPL